MSEPFNYRSKKWRRLSHEVQWRARWRCELCSRTKLELQALGQNLVTHHRLDAGRYPEFAFESMLLIACCEECHATIHGRDFSMKHGPPMVQMDFWLPVLQLDSDMQLFERKERRRSKKKLSAEAGILSDEWMRFEAYGRERALEEANEIVERERQKWRDVGTLEDHYSERGTVDPNDERDADSTPAKTPRSTGPRSA
jgi:hypothetical protein